MIRCKTNQEKTLKREDNKYLVVCYIIIIIIINQTNTGSRMFWMHDHYYPSINPSI